VIPLPLAGCIWYYFCRVLLMKHLQNRISKGVSETVALQRYKKSRIAPQPRLDVFSSWIEDNTCILSIFVLTIRIIDHVVQSYAPQPNLLRRPIPLEDYLTPISSAHLASLAEKVNNWDFHAGQYSLEDLIWMAILILEHVLSTGGPDLEKYKVSRGISLNIPAN